MPERLMPPRTGIRGDSQAGHPNEAVGLSIDSNCLWVTACAGMSSMAAFLKPPFIDGLVKVAFRDGVVNPDLSPQNKQSYPLRQMIKPLFNATWMSCPRR
jgi:hypothetical protein